MSGAHVTSSVSKGASAHSTGSGGSDKQSPIDKANAHHAVNTGIRGAEKSAKQSLDSNTGKGAEKGAEKHGSSYANETRSQQKAREGSEAAKTKAAQEIREAAGHAEAKQRQNKQENRGSETTLPTSNASSNNASHANGASDGAGPTPDKPSKDSRPPSKPTEHKPTDHKPTDNKPTDHKPTDNKATDNKATDNKATDNKATDNKASESKASAQEQGKRSSLPAHSLKSPDLPAEKVKEYINDSVDRNWDQVRSSFNFSNDAKGKNEAKAFFQGAASRESATGETMRTNLITGTGASYSKGPLQTSDTAYANNGHPDWNKDSHVPGIKQADLKDSDDLSTAIDMGIRHMTEGAELGKLGGKTASNDLKLAGMAFHNTGHIDAADKPEWVRDYANETLKMADWYNEGDRTVSKDVVYTGKLG